MNIVTKIREKIRIWREQRRIQKRIKEIKKRDPFIYK